VNPAILLSSRAGGRYLACLVVCAMFSVLWSQYGLRLHWATGHRAVAMGIPELCATLMICLGVIGLRPRMWILDRLGAPSRRWIPATITAIVTLCGPQLVLAFAAAADLPPATWHLSATTTLFLTGLALIASPFIGALRAGSLPLMLYVCTAVATQLDPRFGIWSPLAVVTWPEVEPLPDSKAALAVAAGAAALFVTFQTLGQTRRNWDRKPENA
jgi:hypothetical protein